MPEDLRFDEAAWDGAAVEGDQRPVAAWAALVNGLGAQLLAGAAFTSDEDRGLGGAGALNGAVDSLHGE